MGRRAFTGLGLAAAFLVGTAGCGDDDPVGPEASPISELFGTQLFAANGTSVGLAGLNSAEVIGIYFASVGCSACSAFNPVLVDAYNEIKNEGRPFEVVLVAGGVSLATMYDYMADHGMGWLALSPQSGKANALANRYNVRWVPTLVVIDDEGRLLSLSGRDQVTEKGAEAWGDWTAAMGG